MEIFAKLCTTVFMSLIILTHATTYGMKKINKEKKFRAAKRALNEVSSETQKLIRQKEEILKILAQLREEENADPSTSKENKAEKINIIQNIQKLEKDVSENTKMVEKVKKQHTALKKNK